MKALNLALAALLLAGAGCAAPKPAVTSFEECAAAGNPVMESYPRQCRAGDATFVEEIPEPESVRLEPGAARHLDDLPGRHLPGMSGIRRAEHRNLRMAASVLEEVAEAHHFARHDHLEAQHGPCGLGHGGQGGGE